MLNEYKPTNSIGNVVCISRSNVTVFQWVTAFRGSMNAASFKIAHLRKYDIIIILKTTKLTQIIVSCIFVI